jgi:hypothetical protein
MKWKCSDTNCNYLWESNMNHIRSKNQGCPKCGGSKKLTIEEIKKYLEENRNDLIPLSDTYVNNYTKMKWKCSDTNCNYIWSTTFLSIKSGSSCFKCATRKKNMTLMV